MQKFVQTFVLVLFAFVLNAAAQTKTLKNSDVAEMLKAGLPESTIVLSIQQSKADFDLSPDALIDLKKKGATQNILDAMLRSRPASGEQPAAYREDAFGTSVGSSVVLLEGSLRKPLKRMTPTSKTNNAVRAIPYVGIFMKGKTYAVFNGARSDVRTGSQMPEFEIGISSDIKIADAVYLVRLDPEKKTRRSEIERMGDLGGSTGLRKKDMIQLRIDEITDRSPAVFGISFYRLKPTSILPPGEYALVIMGTLFYDFGVDLIP